MDPLELLLANAQHDCDAAKTADDVDRVRVVYLGRKGKISGLMATLPTMAFSARVQYGQKLNEIKGKIESLLQERLAMLIVSKTTAINPMVPGERTEYGHLHPLTQFSRKVMDIWRSFGYDVHEGPELEEVKYNFDGLNVQADHPVRDIQDTFFIKGTDQLVLRTHASAVQLRSMKHSQPPMKVVEIGKVYRREATDATHEAMFMNCDGVLVDRHVTMAQLVTTLRAFTKRLYPQARTRIRPSFFPFVEPGIEVDFWWEQAGQPGRWMEVVGAGLVHPNVIRAMGLKPTEWQGFAFGFGFDRLAMLEYGVPDIRLFYNANLEFLKQF